MFDDSVATAEASGEKHLDLMLSELRKHRNWMPRNRRKVAQAMPKMGRCQGFTLGLTTDYKLGARGAPVVSKATRAHPALTLALCRGCREACPDFHFTSIQVNLNTKYGMHTDGYDAGPSRMIALGNFSEGQLWLHDCRKNRWSGIASASEGDFLLAALLLAALVSGFLLGGGVVWLCLRRPHPKPAGARGVQGTGWAGVVQRALRFI
eukprot:s2504_g2.t1